MERNTLIIGAVFIAVILGFFLFFLPGDGIESTTTTTIEATGTTVATTTSSTMRPAVTIPSGTSCEELSGAVRDQCYQNKAVEEKDIGVCDNIDLRIPRDLCRDSVTLKIAVDEKNPDKCEEITIKTLRDKCHETLGG
jgi:hypothetical protein